MRVAGSERNAPYAIPLIDAEAIRSAEAVLMRRVILIALAALLLSACATERAARCAVTPTDLVECG